MSRPDLTKVAPFYHNYINQVSQDNLTSAFQSGTPVFLNFIDSIPATKYDYSYAPGKWTIKEILQHVIDAERIFNYRALRFARKDETPLSGFDQNKYVELSKAASRDWNDLKDEFRVVRRSSEYMFRSFDEDQLNATGVSSNNPLYVLGLGYIVIGHTLHHKRIIEERYL